MVEVVLIIVRGVGVGVFVFASYIDVAEAVNNSCFGDVLVLLVVLMALRLAAVPVAAVVVIQQ